MIFRPVDPSILYPGFTCFVCWRIVPWQLFNSSWNKNITYKQVQQYINKYTNKNINISWITASEWCVIRCKKQMENHKLQAKWRLQHMNAVWAMPVVTKANTNTITSLRHRSGLLLLLICTVVFSLSHFAVS